ncbi:uncharacterized protein HMPREF1541_00757 [Cyphellophora europaea CBS 101466]|uniref:3-phytase n=1 Tax=Cyphellophora europaea (strain CBS 101466) TaxID=1220924 RepID=W2SCY9_CYPE1|nr:uncharacterized protein HMPREF1541_00757 [Cyphellophora europaea CBS 101466]ETN46572.1 hypothetical protein HMPREF1541_00757 [Cyphellophora europaea CBS 101466]
MTTLQPRPPYSEEELKKLYPENLELRLVQVLLRHGERAPVSVRFQNAGLAPYWPYCNAAQRLRSVAMIPNGEQAWDSLQWRRRLERFGEDDGPIIAAGAGGEVDGICQLGELTDPGRQSTYALGTRLRHLYVDQLSFMPKLIANADLIYLRATPMPRALESVQQSFWGMYPSTARTAAFPSPTIVTRTPADETLFPNDSNCRRFAQLSRAFAQRTADRWNDTSDMEYLTKLISRWMPESSPRVAVDSHPRLSGIMDTINSTLAHGPETRLPKEFYDKRAAGIIDKVAVEEWFSGYNESREYRKLGIGALAGDIVERMVSKVEGAGLSIYEIGGENGFLGQGRGGEKGILFAMSGCHDTTLASLLTAVGAFNGEKWPPYTSHIAVELFRKKADSLPPASESSSPTAPKSATAIQAASLNSSKPGWISSMLGLSSSASSALTPTSVQQPGARAEGIARRPFTDLSAAEKQKLDGYYVRLRYNDKVMTVPACKKPGNHLDGDDSFCTLETFKRVVDGFTPANWKGECGLRLGEPAQGLDGAQQWAGQIEDDA